MITNPYTSMKKAGGVYPFGPTSNSFIPSGPSARVEAPDQFYTGPTVRLSAKALSPVTSPAAAAPVAAPDTAVEPQRPSLKDQMVLGMYYPWQIGGGGSSPSPSSAAVALRSGQMAGQSDQYPLLAAAGYDWEKWLPHGSAADYTYGTNFWNTLNYRYGLADTL